MLRLCHINLVACNNLRSFGKLGVELNKLLVYFFEILLWISALKAADINNMNKQTAPLNMLQKFVAKAYSLACAFNKAGYIGNNKRAALSHGNNAEVWNKSCEMIIAYFRLCL